MLWLQIMKIFFVSRSRVSKIYFKEISKDTLNWLKVTVKISIANKFSFFYNFLFIKESWKKCIMVCKKNIRQQLLSTLIIRNAYWTRNQHIRRISEGSCDTEDWCNDYLPKYFPLTLTDPTCLNVSSLEV